MKKLSAIIVLVTFLFTLHLSVQPLRGESNQQTSISTSSQPNVVEQESSSYSASKKKSVLPVILGVLAVGAVVAVLVLVVLKTKYDITGDWLLYFKWDGSSNYSSTPMTCKGDKKSGDVLLSNVKYGTYKVDGKDVTITFVIGSVTATYTGKFTDKNRIEGEMTNSYNEHGVWYATRSSSSSSFNETEKSGADINQVIGKERK